MQLARRNSDEAGSRYRFHDSNYFPRLRLWRRRRGSRCCGRGRLFYFALAIAGVAVEGARRREFAELVTDHVLRAIHRDELVAVVDGGSQRDLTSPLRSPAWPWKVRVGENSPSL